MIWLFYALVAIFVYVHIWLILNKPDRYAGLHDLDLLSSKAMLEHEQDAVQRSHHRYTILFHHDRVLFLQARIRELTCAS